MCVTWVFFIFLLLSREWICSFVVNISVWYHLFSDAYNKVCDNILKCKFSYACMKIFISPAYIDIKENTLIQTDIYAHTHTHTHTYIYIYIYIYIVIHRQTVSFYQDSSVWLDMQDARSRDRNPSKFTLD